MKVKIKYFVCGEYGTKNYRPHYHMLIYGLPLNDLKVYKQMDKDFYEKFKAYFTLTGKYTQREKRYEQVGFNYKVCLEAKETIEEQEGEVTFKLDAYPWQEMYKTEYLWAIKPVTVYAKVYASIDLFKTSTETKTVTKTITYKEKV